MSREGKDALDYILGLAGFETNTTVLKGPFSFLLDPNMDDDWRLLLQALGLCIVISLALILDKYGFFARIKSERLDMPPLLVALAKAEDAEQIWVMARRRGVKDVNDNGDSGKDKKKKEKEKDNGEIPSRGEAIEVSVGNRVYAGIVLESKLPRATERNRREWSQRWKKQPCSILLLKGGDSVVVTLQGHCVLRGPLLRWRFPRFLRKAFKRRTNKSLKSVHLRFLSPTHNRVLGVAPVRDGFVKEIEEATTELERQKSD